MARKLINFTLVLTYSFAWASTSFSQNYAKIDSLKQEISYSTGEQRFINLEKLAKEYLYSNTDSCVKYASILLTSATNTQDTLWMAKAEKAIGGTFCISGKLKTGLKHTIEAKNFYTSIDFEEGIYGSTQNIGLIYDMMGEHKKAIKHFHEALPYFAKEQNYAVLEMIYDNLVHSLTLNNQIDSANHYLNLLDKLKEKGQKENCRFSILKADIFSKQQKLDSAKIYYKKEYENALSHHDNYRTNIALMGLGELHIEMKKYSSALNYYELAEDISKEHQYTRMLLSIYQNKTLIYDSIKNYKAAFKELNKLIGIENMLFESENEIKLTELKVKYESEKQDLELAKQKAILSETIAAQKNKEDEMLLFIIAISSIVISLLINMYLKRQSRTKLEKQKKHIEYQQEKIVGSINYAKRIQDSILKPKREIEEIFPSSFVYFKPKDIVSGDFYWFKVFGNIKVISTVDCIGHGVPGAFMSLIVNNLLEKHVTKDSLNNPNIILEKLHQELLENSNLTTAYKGMDMSLCVIHEKEKYLCFSGARNSAYIYNQGNFTKLEADLYSIGAETQKAITFKTRRYDLQKDDILYMYTDGFIDQFGGEKAKKLNMSKFKNLIQDLENIKFKNIPSHINTFLHEWQGNIPQTDDILIFGVKIL